MGRGAAQRRNYGKGYERLGKLVPEVGGSIGAG